jgi:hypothetical protein
MTDDDVEEVMDEALAEVTQVLEEVAARGEDDRTAAGIVLNIMYLACVDILTDDRGMKPIEAAVLIEKCFLDLIERRKSVAKTPEEQRQ